MKFTKMEGCGNDYIYVDARHMEADWPALSRAMSDRHFGVGGDGLILIMDSQIADLQMRMFNADGSEGEMCGNGIRCFAKYVIERDIAKASVQGMTIETLAGVRTAVPVQENGSVTRAKVAMGGPFLRPEEVPVNVAPGKGRKVGEAVVDYPLTVDGVDLTLAFVSMGNPHAVAFIDRPVDEFPLHTIGPQVENHPMFPNRVNFEIVKVEGPGKLNARVWERGSGETMACGTGACAIAVAARILDITHNGQDITNDRIDINLPGGTLAITWDGEGEVYLEGPAVEVFSGEWN
jgi:diaminopimelate epimerase